MCIESITAQRGGGVLGGPHYAAAKGGVQTLAKAMPRELATDNIRINAIAPGVVDTELMIGKLTEPMKNAALAAIPMGRFALPSEIANACLFLASDMSSYVTGAVLDINGGLYVH